MDTRELVGPGSRRSGLHVERISTDDVEVVNANPPPGWTQVVYRLGRERFHYEATRVSLGLGVDIERAHLVGPTRLVGTLHLDALQVLFTTGSTLRVSGVAPAERLVAISPPGARLEGNTIVEATGTAVRLSGAALAGLGAFEQPPALHPGASIVLAVETPAAQALRARLEAYFELLHGNQALALDPDHARAARSQIIDQVRLTLQSYDLAGADVLPPRGRGRRHDLALQIERSVWQQVGGPDSSAIVLAELAREVNASPRTVQLTIEEQFGVTFGAFVRAARLHKAHAALARADGRSVAEIATRYGFWHLGRFSQYYREVFGVAPSATLRKARGRTIGSTRAEQFRRGQNLAQAVFS